MKYVLFVCTQNAGRSQMAQAFFERYAPEDVRGESAGDAPAAPSGSASEAIREDRTQHQMRIGQLVPGLVDEFGEVLSDEEIRGIADEILEGYDAVPVRSFVMTLANRRARELLKQRSGTPA